MRFMVLFKMTSRELQRTLHPHMVVSLKIDGVPVDMKIVSRVLSYFFLVIITFFASMLIISLAGVTPIQAMAMAVAVSPVSVRRWPSLASPMWHRSRRGPRYTAAF